MITDRSHYCRFCLNFWKDMFIKHLVTYLETRDLSHPLQSGFRCKHSCNTALARLTDSWLSVINRSDLSGDVFLDKKKRERKAFDLVHRILLSKLSVYLNSSNLLPVFCPLQKPCLNHKTRLIAISTTTPAQNALLISVSK